MDAIMRESTSAQYIMKQGIEKGREDGIERGQRKGTLEDLMDVLEIRFGLSAAHPIFDRIAAIDDLQLLKQLHRAAIQVSNLEAFEQALDA